MYYYKELLPSTAVDFAILSDFIDSAANNVLIVKGNLLEVYEIIKDNSYREHLVIVEYFEFYSKILALVALKPSVGSDILLLCFPTFKISVIKFNSQTRQINILQIFDFEQKYISQHAIPYSLSEYAIFRCNLSKNICSLVENNQIIFFFLREPTGSEPNIEACPLDLSQSHYKLGRIVDLEFLETYGNDTVGILTESLSTDLNLLNSRADTCCFGAYVIDDKMVSLIHIWSKTNLPFDSYKLIPVCGEIGGVAIFGNYQIMYLSQIANPYTISCTYKPSTTYNNSDQTLPPEFSFKNSSIAVISKNQILASLDSGDLYILDFIHDNRKLEKIEICSLNFHHMTSCILSYKDLTFLGSRTQNSLLVDINGSLNPTRWRLDVLDELFNVGCPVSACLGRSSCNKYLELCLLCESGKSSKIHILEKNVPFTEISSLNIPTATKIWFVTAYSGFSEFSYLVISLESSTMILQSGDEMVEIENGPFINDEATIEVFMMPTGDIFQVTETKLRLLQANGPKCEIPLEYKVSASSRVYPHVFVMDHSFNLRTYFIGKSDITLMSTREDIIMFSSLKLMEDDNYMKFMIATVTKDGILRIAIEGCDYGFICESFFQLKNTFYFTMDKNSKSDVNGTIFDTNENIFGISEIFLAYLGKTKEIPFLFIHCVNFIAVYETVFADGTVLFRKVNKFINLSADEPSLHLFNYIQWFKKFPAVFIRTQMPRIVISTDSETLSIFTVDLEQPLRCLVPFNSNKVDFGYVCLDDGKNVRFLQLARSGSFHKGWVHKTYPIDFIPDFIDFHQKYNVYFISGHHGLNAAFSHAYIYTFSCDDSIKEIKTLEQQEISHMKLLNLNYMDSRAIFLVVSSNMAKENGIFGNLSIFDIVSEDGFTLIPLHTVEFNGGIAVFDSLDGKIVISSMDKIYMVEYDKDSRSFISVCYLQSCYAALSLKSLKDFILFGDLVTGLNLLHYQKDVNLMSLLGKKNVNKYPMCVDFIINDIKTDLVCSFSDRSLITFSYNPEISKTKNGTELIMTSGMKLPSRVVKMIKILDSQKLFTNYVTLMLLLQNSGGIGVLIPIPEKIFRRYIMLKSRLNNDLPDECALNFSRERGEFCDVRHQDTNTKQILDEILFKKFLSLELPTCYDSAKNYGLPFCQLFDDAFLLDQIVVNCFRFSG